MQTELSFEGSVSFLHRSLEFLGPVAQLDRATAF